MSKIDPYTGKNVTRIDTPGRYVENKSIVIKIKNQEFVSSVNGTKYHMAYKIAYKGHFGEEWKENYFESQCTMTRYLSKGFPKASNSDYTVLRIPADYSHGVRLDVKVQAYIGHEAVITVKDYVPGHAFPIPAGSHDEDGIIFGTAGDWSEIQTITINFPPSAEQIILPVAPILIPIAVYLVGIIYIIKRKSQS
ncbi:MAG: hypothetical protein PVI43_02990 [Candidatus Bathyarchaeota archaeon]